jgi:hypothetical protein
MDVAVGRLGASLLAVFAVLASLAGLSPTVAQTRGHKLSGELGLGTDEDVSTFTVAADGYVVFRHAYWELQAAIHSVLADGSARALLTPYLIASPLGTPRVTHDGSRVVFSAGSDLYEGFVDGTFGPRRVAANWAHVLDDVQISPDDGWAVYRIEFYDAFDDETYTHLYAARLGGAVENVRLDGTGYAVHVGVHAISSDSSRVVYRTHEGLFSRRIDGSLPRVLLSPSGRSFAVTPDGQTVLFADGVGGDLFSAPIDGGPPVRIGPASAAATWDHGSAPHVEGALVHFVAGTPRALWRGSVDGSSAPVRLDPAGAVGGVTAFTVLPGASHVLYTVQVASGLGRELLRVPTDGSRLAVPVSGAPVAGGGVRAFRVAAGGARVVFTGDMDVDERFELYGAPTDGSAPRARLGTALGADADVDDDVTISPDGGGVLYRADLVQDGRVELFAASALGPGPSFRINAPLVPGGNVLDHEVGPGGQRVFYLADQDTDDAIELYAVHLASPGTAVRLNEPFAYHVVGEVVSFHPSPDGEHVVYDAHLLGDSIRDLHSLSLTDYGASNLTASVLSVEHPANAGTTGVLGFARAGREVVYTVDDRGPLSVPGTYVSRVDGTGAPRRLDAVPSDSLTRAQKLSPDGEWLAFKHFADGLFQAVRTDGTGGVSTLGEVDAEDWEVSPDSERLVFALYPHPAPRELFSSPLDGSASPVRISGPMIAAGNYVDDSLIFAPDGRAVLYLADAVVNEQVELFRTAVDGSSPAVRLNGPLPAGGDVIAGSVRITPDGTRAVYVADETVDGQQDLYAVPLDRATSPLRLSSFALHGQVTSWLVEASDERAVFTAGQKLYSAPLDASTPPLRLYPFAGVTEARITPDGVRVVFLFSEILLSVPIDLSTPAVKLSESLGLGVQTFQIGADGRHVAFFHRLDTGEAGLFAVPTEGGQPRRLSRETPWDLDVRAYRLLADGNRLIYLADPLVDERFELFESFLVPPHRPR